MTRAFKAVQQAHGTAGQGGEVPLMIGRTTALITGKVTEAEDPAGEERRLWDGIR